MSRGVRWRFFLAFHERPPAANVYREDAIYTPNGGPTIFPHPGQRITVKPGRSPDTFTVTVLFTGKKTELEKMKVDTAGRVYLPDVEVQVAPGTRYVGTLYHEKLKMKAASGDVLREGYLHELAEGIAGVGPGPEDFAPKKVCRRPKIHTSAEIDQLKEECRNLPCWKQTHGDIEVITGTKVYANGAVLNHLKGDFRKDPIRLFKEIIKLCAGEFTSKRGVCATEVGAKHRGKVQFPPAVVHAAFGYCTVNCTTPVTFEPTYILRTFLDKRQIQREKSSATQGSAPAQTTTGEDPQRNQGSTQTSTVEDLEQENSTEDEQVIGPSGPTATPVGLSMVAGAQTQSPLLSL